MTLQKKTPPLDLKDPEVTIESALVIIERVQQTLLMQGEQVPSDMAVSALEMVADRLRAGRGGPG